MKNIKRFIHIISKINSIASSPSAFLICGGGLLFFDLLFGAFTGVTAIICLTCVLFFYLSKICFLLVEISKFRRMNIDQLIIGSISMKDNNKTKGVTSEE